MDLITMTRQLGAAIQQSEVYLKYMLAKQNADDNAQLQDMIGRFNLKRLELNNELSKSDKDQDKINEINKEMRALYDEIMADSTMKAFNECKTELNGLLQNINYIINQSANGEDPMTIEPSCAGGCETCSGCGN